MTSEQQSAPSLDDYLKDGWVPIAETSVGITFEKSDSSPSWETIIGGVLIALWGLWSALYAWGLTMGIVFLGLAILGIYENTRPPLRMLILHDKGPGGSDGERW